MKWIYLPVMFALSFCYTKMSLNDFIPKKVATVVPIGRRPASVDEISTLKPFRQRVPPAAFYEQLRNEGTTTFASVANFKGVVVSDVHVENFGFVIDDTKKANYSIMDFNEVSEGQLFHDVLAHLISSKALDKRTSWIQYFEAYKRGLKHETHQYSFYVEKGIDNALIDSERIIEQNIVDDFSVKFTKLKKDHRVANALITTAIQKELKLKFPKIQIFELYESLNYKGQFQILARVRPMDKVQWMVLREKLDSDHDHFFEINTKLIPATYLSNLKKNIYSGKIDKTLVGLLINKKLFTLKFAEQFSSHLEFDQIPIEDFNDILMDQAYVLGSIHGNSLGTQVDNYIKAWATIPAAIVDEKAVELKFKLKDQFAE
jgi:hypothetical protein